MSLAGLNQVLVWRLWRRGWSRAAIARELRVPAREVAAVVCPPGGIVPPVRRRAAGSLTLACREEISRGLAADLSLREIGRRLGRNVSVISREVAAAGGRDSYRALAADQAAWDRARRPKPVKLARDAWLAALVGTKLAGRWSPRQISAWLRREFPDDPEMRVSHETIYVTLYVQSRGALRQELARYLRRKKQPLRQRRSSSQRGQIPGKIMLSERPAEASDRAVPGHWEGDLVLGSGSSAVATLVERHSRYVMILALPGGKGCEAVRDTLTGAILGLPEHLRRAWKTLTWDQGKEMSQHAQFTIDTGIQIYFCPPGTPWLRGSNENTNGLIRQYLPKGTNLATTTQNELDDIACELNTRPRQTLGWLTPSEALNNTVAPTP